MKTIKVIIVIITVLVIAFFSIGLLVKDTTFTTQITIEKPVATVFSTFNDTSKLKEWIPEFKSIETIEEKLGKTGSTYKIIVDNNGQDIVMQEKILAFVPNEKVTLYYNAGKGNMLKKDDYVFSSHDNSTTITHNASCSSGKFIMSCMFPIFKSKFKEQDQEYLNNLKVFLEKE